MTHVIYPLHCVYIEYMFYMKLLPTSAKSPPHKQHICHFVPQHQKNINLYTIKRPILYGDQRFISLMRRVVSHRTTPFEGVDSVKTFSFFNAIERMYNLNKGGGYL